MDDIQRKMWIDSINFHIQDGLPLEEAMEKAKVLANAWPFPDFPNPLDTGHKRPKFNPLNHEDALL